MNPLKTLTVTVTPEDGAPFDLHFGRMDAGPLLVLAGMIDIAGYGLRSNDDRLEAAIEENIRDGAGLLFPSPIDLSIRRRQIRLVVGPKRSVVDLRLLVEIAMHLINTHDGRAAATTGAQGSQA